MQNGIAKNRVYTIKRYDRGKREPIITIPKVRKHGKNIKIKIAVIFCLSKRDVSEVALVENNVKFKINPTVTYDPTKANPIINP